MHPWFLHGHPQFVQVESSSFFSFESPGGWSLERLWRRRLSNVRWPGGWTAVDGCGMQRTEFYHVLLSFTISISQWVLFLLLIFVYYLFVGTASMQQELHAFGGGSSSTSSVKAGSCRYAALCCNRSKASNDTNGPSLSDLSEKPATPSHYQSFSHDSHVISSAICDSFESLEPRGVQSVIPAASCCILLHIPSMQIVNLVDFEECNPPASPRARLSDLR